MVSGLSEYLVPAALLLLFVIYFIIGKFMTRCNIFAPWNVTLVVWSAILVMYVFWGDLLYPIKGPFYIALLCWVTAFTVASIVVYKLTCSFTKNNTNDEFVIHKSIFYILLIISILVTPIYFYKAYTALGGIYTNIVTEMRVNANTGALELGVLKYVKEMNMALLVVALWSYKNMNKLVFTYLIVVNLLLGATLMSKATFFYIMMAIMFIAYSKKAISRKTIIIILGIFLILSFAFTSVRDASANYNFFQFFSLYILSPSVAFEQLTPCSGDYWGANTFPFFYYFVDFFTGESHEIVMKLKDFVLVPLPTNVFTVMQPYYQDFGYVGVAVFGALNGAIFGFIYRWVMNHNAFAKCLYVYVLEILVLQFFQDEFIVSMSVFLQMIFWNYLLVGKRFIKA